MPIRPWQSSEQVSMQGLTQCVLWGTYNASACFPSSSLWAQSCQLRWETPMGSSAAASCQQLKPCCRTSLHRQALCSLWWQQDSWNDCAMHGLTTSMLQCLQGFCSSCLLLMLFMQMSPYLRPGV